MSKRFLDITVAAAGLVFTAPLLAVIALLVRLDSPGPALFRQRRVGRYGREFTILKFRSMTVAEDRPDGSKITVAGDARVTRLGKLLRRSKLDELPQLWNVLRGDMSLVGPRPEVPEYVAYYDESQQRVLQYRPGITCASSLAMFDEELLLARSDNPQKTYREVVMPEKLRLAIQYAEQANIATDISVIGQTCARMGSSFLPRRAA